MAHDAKREDYQRLSLRYALELDKSGATDAARAFAAFGRRFAQNRDSLPQSDADRAFHLVALATEIIDYRLPHTTRTNGLFKKTSSVRDMASDAHTALHYAAFQRRFSRFEAFVAEEMALSPRRYTSEDQLRAEPLTMYTWPEAIRSGIPLSFRTGSLTPPFSWPSQAVAAALPMRPAWASRSCPRTSWISSGIT